MSIPNAETHFIPWRYISACTYEFIPICRKEDVKATEKDRVGTGKYVTIFNQPKIIWFFFKYL